MKNAPFLKRLGFAISGISQTLKKEPSFKFQIFATLGAFLTLITLGANASWWAIFSLSIAAVLGAELFNTAIENLLDGIHPEFHPQIKIAKDGAAGAVLIFSISSLMIFISFLLSH